MPVVMPVTMPVNDSLSPPLGPPGRHVAVVGGGLAGLTAACTLVDAGLGVTLLEARSHLGGAAFSFRREGPAGLLAVDNGQHVVLRCYERYLALLQRLGTVGRIRFQRRLRIPVRVPGGGCAVLERPGLERPGLPAAASLVAAVARYRLLRVPERLQALRAAGALVRLDSADPRLDAMSFGDWLAARRQPDRVRRAFWDLLSVAALNARPEDASLGLAAMVFRTAFGSGRADAADLGMADGPLDEIHAAPAERYLVVRGARVLRHSPVRRLVARDGVWVVHHEVSGRAHELRCDAVVLAVPATAATGLLPPGALPEPAVLHQLGSAPIVSLHVCLDRPVLPEPFTAAVGTPVSWVFARPAPAGCAQYLTIPVSAAQDWIGRSSPEIRDRVVPALCSLLPATRDARVRDVFVTRERHATFHQRPGTARLRPAARSGLPGLALAGAWTATGWPDTLEGAVRSGESAAAAVLATETEAGTGLGELLEREPAARQPGGYRPGDTTSTGGSR
jgi:squalene-associated FAD-dependent desaturase